MARKEVNLSSKIIKKLQKLADKDKRKLKPYMEKVLENHVMPKEYKILDCNGIEILPVYWVNGKPKYQIYEKAKKLVDSLNKTGEFKPYKIIPIE